MLTRRSFFGFGSLVIAACAPRRLQARDDARAPTPSVPDEHPHDEVCTDITASNIEGPFYKAGAPHRAVLAGPDEPGDLFVVSGVIRRTDCSPIAGAEMDIWHADARGGYDNDGYHLRGKLVADKAGRFELRTIVPGRYLNGDTYRPAHIHVKVRAPGHRTLTTQLYFAGDPYNDIDPFIVPSLIMQHSRGRARFDFTLASL